MQRIFVQDKPSHSEIPVPFFEDAREDFAPYYGTKYTERELQNQVLQELMKLDGIGVFKPGHVEVNGKKRYGYELHFQYRGAKGRITVLGLPIRSETVIRIKQSKSQALANLRDWLKVAVTMQVFGDTGAVFVPYMLVDGNRTVAEVMLGSGYFPALPSGEVVIEGEFIHEG